MKTFSFLILFLAYTVCCLGQITHEAEPNNTPASANFLGILPTASGAMSLQLLNDTLNYNGDVDWYKVRIKRAGVLTISIPSNASGFTFVINIRDSTGTNTIHAVPSAASPNNTPVNEAVVPAGTWCIGISRFGGVNDGFYNPNHFYDLHVTLDTSEQYEWNNDYTQLSTANPLVAPLSQNAVVQGYIKGYYDFGGSTSSQIDRDIYKIYMSGAGTMTANIAANTTGISLRIQLADSNLNQFGNSFTAAGAGGAVNASYNISAGYWYIWVSSASLNTSNQPYTLRIGTPTGIEATSCAVKAWVYPNPSNGAFTIETGAAQNEPRTLIITDLSGRNVYEQYTTLGKLEVQLKQPAGMYFISSFSARRRYAEKIIIR